MKWLFLDHQGWIIPYSVPIIALGRAQTGGFVKLFGLLCCGGT